MEFRQNNLKTNNLDVGGHKIAKKDNETRPYSFANDSDAGGCLSSVHHKTDKHDSGDKTVEKEEKKHSYISMQSLGDHLRRLQNRNVDRTEEENKSEVKEYGDQPRSRANQYKTEARETNGNYFPNDKKVPQKDVNEAILKESNKSTATYLTIRPESESPNFKPVLPQRRDRSPKRKAPRYRRIILIAVSILCVFAVAVVAGFVIYFVANKAKTYDCPDPKVENGNATIIGETVSLHCEYGHLNPVKQPIKCENGHWSESISCPIVDCGDPPVIINGSFKFQNTTFGNNASIACIDGYMVSCLPEFGCSAEGIWNSSCDVSCVPHPCGRHGHLLPKYARTENDFSYVNWTMKLSCDDGFAFTSNSDIYIRCDNGTQIWTQNATCEIPGSITFTPTDTVFKLGEKQKVICSVQDSPGWKTVTLKQLRNGSEPVNITKVSNISGVLDIVSQPHVKVFPSVGGVYIEMSLDVLRCEDNGIYKCSIIVREEEKSANKTIHVLEQSSTIPVLTATGSTRQGENLTCTCNGTLGLDENGKKLGEMYLQIKYQNETGFTNMTTISTQSFEWNCQLVELIEATFKVTNAMNNATLRCITTTVFKESPLVSNNHTLTVNTTKVNMSASKQPWKVGQSASISATISNILGWKNIEIRKVCGKMETTLSRLHKNISSEDLFQHIALYGVNISDESADVVLYFNYTECSDACAKGIPVNYSVVTQLNDEWHSGRTTIAFYDAADIPIISANPDKFYLDQEVRIQCRGDVGIPNGTMILKRNNVQLNAKSDNYFDNDTCTNNQSIDFSFIVSSESQGDTFECITNLENATMLRSENLTVNVTEPVLYFTEESRNGVIGEKKNLTCILTSTANFTSVALYRGASIDPLCTWNVGGSGSCKEIGYFIKGRQDQNYTRFITDVDISAVTCKDDAEFTCIVYGKSTFKTTFKFNATKATKKPVLRLPQTLVVNQFTFWEDVLNCTADLGHPSTDRFLQLHVFYTGSQSYQKFSAAANRDGCESNATVQVQAYNFNSTFNGSTIRCAVVDSTEAVLEEVSKTIVLLPNICLLQTSQEFNPHPYNCRRFARCISNLMYDFPCAPNSCALSYPPSSTDQICNQRCDGCI